MTMISEDLDMSLDFTPVLQCEGFNHEPGLSGHDRTQPGKFLMICPCCPLRAILCDARVQFILNGGTFGLLYCGRCAHEHLIEQYRFIPIGGP